MAPTTYSNKVGQQSANHSLLLVKLKVCVAEIHYAALTEQLLKRLRHLKVIIKRDYMNYQPTYQHKCKDTHTQLCTNSNLTPTHMSTGATIQQHTGNLSKCSKFILAAKAQEQQRLLAWRDPGQMLHEQNCVHTYTLTATH